MPCPIDRLASHCSLAKYPQPRRFCVRVSYVFTSGHGFSRAINGFDGADPQPILDDPAHDHAMKAQRIRPVGRSRISRRSLVRRCREITAHGDHGA
jgi:hypothetical protein